MQEHPEPERRTAAQINDRLIANLRNLSHVMRSLYEGKGSQTRILIVLGQIGGPVTQRELTERLGIRPGSASEVIAKLESAGYLTRSPNATDQRTSDIVLTEAGTAAASEAKRQRDRRHEEMFSCLSEEEKQELLRLLEKVNGDWKERYQGVGTAPGTCGHPHRGHRQHGRMHRQEGE